MREQACAYPRASIGAAVVDDVEGRELRTLAKGRHHFLEVPLERLSRIRVPVQFSSPAHSFRGPPGEATERDTRKGVNMVSKAWLVVKQRGMYRCAAVTGLFVPGREEDGKRDAAVTRLRHAPKGSRWEAERSLRFGQSST